jgi:hypothetical protein
MPCKNTILNSLVANAADLMESQKEFNECVIQQFKEKGGCEDRIAKLEEENRRITEAVALMRENAGCWA